MLYFLNNVILVQSPPNIIKEPSADEILFQVAIDQYSNDKPFIIDCEAEGEPVPKYYKLFSKIV